MACPGGVGLTTALGILPGGWVVVGSLPTTTGVLPGGDPASCLIELNDQGTVAETITNKNIAGGAGDLFGIATTSGGMIAVNDGTNALDLYRG
jgi:hypothetical protein